MRTPNPISMVILVTSLACFLGSAGAARQDSARTAITVQSHKLMAAIESGDAAAVAELFTTEAKLSVSPSGGLVSGRTHIAGFWKAALDGGLKGLVLTPADLLGDGNLRLETGSFTALGAERRELGRGQY